MFLPMGLRGLRPWTDISAACTARWAALAGKRRQFGSCEYPGFSGTVGVKAGCLHMGVLSLRCVLSFRHLCLQAEMGVW